MSTNADKKLTIQDPIDQETLQRLGQIHAARMQVAERLLDLEQEKVRTLRVAGQVDHDRQKIFETILTSRGLPPNFPIEIDAKTGLLKAVEGYEGEGEAPQG